MSNCFFPASFTIMNVQGKNTNTLVSGFLSTVTCKLLSPKSLETSYLPHSVDTLHSLSSMPSLNYWTLSSFGERSIPLCYPLTSHPNPWIASFLSHTGLSSFSCLLNVGAPSVLSFLYTAVPPYSRETCFKIPRGCLKSRIVLNPILVYTIFFPIRINL